MHLLDLLAIRRAHHHGHQEKPYGLVSILNKNLQSRSKSRLQLGPALCVGWPNLRVVQIIDELILMKVSSLDLRHLAATATISASQNSSSAIPCYLIADAVCPLRLYHSTACDCIDCLLTAIATPIATAQPKTHPNRSPIAGHSCDAIDEENIK